MPQYLYRREDGSTFTVRQKFSDDPLTVDPETGQDVVRVIQPTGIIFKGSGFYVNDSKNASKTNLTTAKNGSEAGASTNETSESSASTSNNGTGESKPATSADSSSSSSVSSSSNAAAS